MELEEETDLVVDPADLVLVETSTNEVVEDQWVVTTLFAVSNTRISGTVEAGSNAGSDSASILCHAPAVRRSNA